MFGNVNVDYKPCKSAVQVQRAADYMLGRLPEQARDGLVKTAPNLYWSFNCDRDNFARDVMITRNLFGKKNSGNANLTFKMSISFHPDDNDRLSYSEVLKIAAEFAQRYFKGYEVLFAVHTDTEHKHVHFLIGNCNIETGKAFRRSQRDLYEMCEFFGQQCAERGLTHSIRDSYFKQPSNNNIDKETFAERQMKANGKETFKDELREVILIELNDRNNHTLDDVVNALMKHYNVECRVKGNTISYRHPNFTDKSGKLVSVRGSKLGDKYTVKGILHELEKKSGDRTATDRAENSIFIPRVIAQDSGATTSATDRNAVFITKNGGASGEKQSNGSSNSGVGADRDMGKIADTGNIGDIGGFQERRESNAHGSVSDKDVPTLEELFRSYDHRNGKNRRNVASKPEHTETVRRKRKGIDR